jgi:uncharacterized protein YjbI with pentapeptide repeats
MFVAVLISGKYLEFMTQPLDFSNQDLRNRSFKGRKDLAGADFRKADIRGCNFSGANLEGANFSGLTSGQSGQQIFIAFAFAFAGAFAGGLVFGLVIAGAGVGAFMGAFTFGFGFAGAFGFGFAGAVAGAGAVTFVFVFVIMFMVGFLEFAKGNILGGIGYSLVALFSLFLSYILLKQALEEIRNMTGTSFKETELTNTKFTGAILNNCDFTDATLHHVDWTHARFRRCKFSTNLAIRKVQELCISRIGANDNFNSIDLSGLHLVGVNLSGADLTAANLNDSNLSQSILENTILANAQAVKTNFSKATLTGACIEKWAITSETIFTNTICDYIFLDLAKNECKPASGKFEQGDFDKLVNQFTTTLDFLFRNGIDPQAFDFALNNLIEDYEELGIFLKSVEDVGDGDKLIRFNTVPDAPKAEMHAQFTIDYEEMHQQLEASRNKIWELQQKLDRIDLENKIERFELEKQLAIATAKLEERPTSQYLQNLVYHQANQKLLYAPHSTFGDTMTDKSIQSGGDVFFTGRDNLGVSGKDQQGVAGRDISGTVTNTLQQLRETNQPEAPQLSELLEQLQQAVESSSELGEPEKQKALEYLNQIGEMSAKEPSQKKGMLPILLDAFTGVISKAANLIDPVKKIAAAILSIWQA